MNNQLAKLRADSVDYRKAVDHIFSLALTTPQSWQECFSSILICTSQLYLDYLLITKSSPALKTISSKEDGNRIRLDTLREKGIRERLQQKLESSTCWDHHFKPENAFSELTGLRSQRDYTDRLTLHLPEIYEESFRVETCVQDFLASHNEFALIQLLAGLQHLGRHHITFVLQTLEWIADEGSWEELLSAPKDS